MSLGSLLHPILPLDPLPRYSRNPETVSVHSIAPSYTSEAPSYHSSSLSITRHPQTTTRPPRRRNLSSSATVSSLEHHAYNIEKWSSVTTGHQARHYEAVAHRRAMSASTSNQTGAFASAVSMLHPVCHSLPTTSFKEDTAQAVHRSRQENVLEDLSLDSSHTAVHIQAQKAHIKKSRDEKALVEEGKSWDILLMQMADWKEREENWSGLRRAVGGKTERQRGKGYKTLGC